VDVQGAVPGGGDEEGCPGRGVLVGVVG
jgi:hypothetical protein